MKPAVESHLKTILDLAEKSGSPIFLVGGTLRDLLSEKPCADYDFASHKAPEIARKFSEAAGRKCVALDETPGHETYRVVIHKDLYFDFTTLQGRTLADDLAQRDFTINAMGLLLADFIEGNIQPADPFGGREDLKHRTVRAIPGPTFQNDPLRLLRAFRFAAACDFDIDAETLQEIKSHRQLLNRVAKERVAYEMLILFSANNSRLELLDQSGLAEILFPGIADLKTASGRVSGTSAWQDTLNRFREMETLLQEPERFLAQHTGLAREFIATGRHYALMKWAILAKALYPGSPSYDPLADSLREFRLSNDDIEFVVRTLRGSSVLISFFHGTLFQDIDEDAALYRLIKSSGEELLSALLVSLACRLGDQEDLELFTGLAFRILDFYTGKYLPALMQPALLNGKILKKKFALPPSPLFQTILEQVEEARVLGTIQSAKEAEEMARNIIHSQSSSST